MYVRPNSNASLRPWGTEKMHGFCDICSFFQNIFQCCVVLYYYRMVSFRRTVSKQHVHSIIAPSLLSPTTERKRKDKQFDYELWSFEPSYVIHPYIANNSRPIHLKTQSCTKRPARANREESMTTYETGAQRYR